jgi:DNA (cytosine-5)-methyltransferase 1
MISILDEIGYNVVPVQVLKAINFKVPQKRERLILVGIRKDIDLKYEYPKPYKKIYNLKDALKKGELFDCNVPKSEGAKYPKSKKDVLDLVPQKGYWRDLPLIFKRSLWVEVFILVVEKLELQEE